MLEFREQLVQMLATSVLLKDEWDETGGNGLEQLPLPVRDLVMPFIYRKLHRPFVLQGSDKLLITEPEPVSEIAEQISQSLETKNSAASSANASNQPSPQVVDTQQSSIAQLAISDEGEGCDPRSPISRGRTDDFENDNVAALAPEKLPVMAGSCLTSEHRSVHPLAPRDLDPLTPRHFPNQLLNDEINALKMGPPIPAIPTEVVEMEEPFAAAAEDASTDQKSSDAVAEQASSEVDSQIGISSSPNPLATKESSRRNSLDADIKNIEQQQEANQRANDAAPATQHDSGNNFSG